MNMFIVMFLLPVVGGELLYERRVFPNVKTPLVCATFVSYKRLDLLERAMVAAMRHLDDDEPDWLSYEVAWYDNGSGETATTLAAKLQVEHLRLEPRNSGLPAGINALVREMCTASYVLFLEEDWEYGGDSDAAPGWVPSTGAPAKILLPTPRRKIAVATAAGLLAAEAATSEGLADLGPDPASPSKMLRRQILGVTLRSETLDSVIKGVRRSPWTKLQVTIGAWSTEAEYRTYCLDYGSNQLWAAYTNGAALYNRSRLVELGPMFGDPRGVFPEGDSLIFRDANFTIGGVGFPSHYGEPNYALRAGLRYCSATLRLEDGCEGTPDFVGGTCSAAFVHTGHGRGYGLEKRNAATSDDERDKIWSYAATPLFDAIIAFRRLVDLESVPQAIAGLQSAMGVALASPIAKRLAEEQAAASLASIDEARECAAPSLVTK